MRHVRQVVSILEMIDVQKQGARILLMLGLFAINVSFARSEPKECNKHDLKICKKTWQTESLSKIQIKTRKIDNHDCNARLTNTYLQLNQRAQVNTRIENSDCPRSSGKYTVRLRITDSRGEPRVIEHAEIWASDNGAPYETQLIYDIGENVELQKVTTLGLSCVCDTAEQSE